MQNTILIIGLAAFTLANACTQTENGGTAMRTTLNEPPTVAQPQDPPGEVALPGQQLPRPWDDPPQITLNDSPPGDVNIPYSPDAPDKGNRTAIGAARELCPKTVNTR